MRGLLIESNLDGERFPNAPISHIFNPTTSIIMNRQILNRLLILSLPLVFVFFVAEYYTLSTLEQSSRYLRLVTEPTQGPLFDAAINMSTRPPAGSRTLPNFHEEGGLVVFLHVAKTGGTTIRKNFDKLPNVLLRRVFDEEELKASQPRIEWFLSKKNKNRTMLLEIHGNHGEPMTVFDIHRYIQHWRALGADHNKKVFVFTLLRDPLSFSVSYFNFFKHPKCHWDWCDTPLMPLTEENLLESAIPNHQCQYLARPATDKAANAANPVTSTECETVYTMLKSDADWIGTTEAMQTTTLPILSWMITGDAAMDMPTHNKQDKSERLSTHQLSESAKAELRQRSALDQSLHDRIQRDFPIAIWDNFQPVALKQ